MYHYYVRYSVISSLVGKIFEGCTAIASDSEISTMSQIEQICTHLAKDAKKQNRHAGRIEVFIDFYQLFRKDPN